MRLAQQLHSKISVPPTLDSSEILKSEKLHNVIKLGREFHSVVVLGSDRLHLDRRHEAIPGQLKDQ